MTRARDKTWGECLSGNQSSKHDSGKWECAKEFSKQRETKRKDARAIVEIFLSKNYIKERTVQLRKTNRDESEGNRKETRHFTQNVRFDDEDPSSKRDRVKLTNSSTQIGESVRGNQLHSIGKTSQKPTSPKTNFSSSRSKMEVPGCVAGRKRNSRERRRVHRRAKESDDSSEQYVTNYMPELKSITSLGATADDVGKRKRENGGSSNATLQGKSDEKQRTGLGSRGEYPDRLSSTSMEPDAFPVSHHSQSKTVKSREATESKNADTQVFHISKRRSRMQSHHKSILYDSATPYQEMEDSLGRILSESRPNNLSRSSGETACRKLKFVKPNVIDDSTYVLPEDDPTHDFGIIPYCHRKEGHDSSAPTRQENCLHKSDRRFESSKEIQKAFIEKSRVVLEDALSQESRTNGSLPRNRVIKVKPGHHQTKDKQVNQDLAQNSRTTSLKDKLRALENEAKHISSPSRISDSRATANEGRGKDLLQMKLPNPKNPSQHESKQHSPKHRTGQPQSEAMNGLERRSQSEVKEIFRRKYSKLTSHGNVSKSQSISYTKRISKKTSHVWKPTTTPKSASNDRKYENGKDSRPSKIPFTDQAQNQGSLQMPPQGERNTFSYGIKPKVNRESTRRSPASLKNKNVSSQTLEFRQHVRRTSDIKSGVEKHHSSDRSGNGAGFPRGSKFESRRPDELEDLQSIPRFGSYDDKRESTRSETMGNERSSQREANRDTNSQPAQDLEPRWQRDYKSQECSSKLESEPPAVKRGTYYPLDPIRLTDSEFLSDLPKRDSQLTRQTGRETHLCPETERNSPTDRRDEYPSRTGAEAREMDSAPTRPEELPDPRQASVPKGKQYDGFGTTKAVPQGTSPKCKSRLSPQHRPSDKAAHGLVVYNPWRRPFLPKGTTKASQSMRNTNCDDQLDPEMTENVSQSSSSKRESRVSHTWRSHEFQARDLEEDIAQSSVPPALHDEAGKSFLPSDPRAIGHGECRNPPERGSPKRDLNPSSRFFPRTPRDAQPLSEAGVDVPETVPKEDVADGPDSRPASENFLDSKQKSNMDRNKQERQRDSLKQGPNELDPTSSLSHPQESQKGTLGHFQNSDPRTNTSNSKRTTDPARDRPADDDLHPEEELKENGESPTLWKHESQLSPHSPLCQRLSGQRVQRHLISLLEPHVPFAEKTSVSSTFQTNPRNESNETGWRSDSKNSEEFGEAVESNSDRQRRQGPGEVHMRLFPPSNRLLPELPRIASPSQTLKTDHDATCNKGGSSRKHECTPMESELDLEWKYPTGHVPSLSPTSSPYPQRLTEFPRTNSAVAALKEDLSKKSNKPRSRVTCNQMAHESKRGSANRESESTISIPSLHGLEKSDESTRDPSEPNPNHGFTDFELISSHEPETVSKRVSYEDDRPAWRNEDDFQLKLNEPLPTEALTYPLGSEEICQKQPGDCKDREHMSSQGTARSFPSNTDQASSMQLKPLMLPPLHIDQSHGPLKQSVGEANSSQNKKTTSICEAQLGALTEEPSWDALGSVSHGLDHPRHFANNELKTFYDQSQAKPSSASQTPSQRPAYERNNSYFCVSDPSVDLPTDPSLDGSPGDQLEDQGEILRFDIEPVLHDCHTQGFKREPLKFSLDLDKPSDTQSEKCQNDISPYGDKSRDISQGGTDFSVITNNEEASKLNPDERAHEKVPVGSEMQKNPPTPSVVKMEYTASLHSDSSGAPRNRDKPYLSDSLEGQGKFQGFHSELQNLVLYLQNRLKACEKKVKEQLATAAQDRKDRRRHCPEASGEEVKKEAESSDFDEMEEFHSDACEAEVCDCRDAESLGSDSSDIPQFQGCDCMRVGYYKIMRLAYNK